MVYATLFNSFVFSDTLVWRVRRSTSSGFVPPTDTLNGSLTCCATSRRRMLQTCWRCTSSSHSSSTSLTCVQRCSTFARTTSSDYVGVVCLQAWRPSTTLAVLTWVASWSLFRRSIAMSARLACSPAVQAPWPSRWAWAARRSTGSVRFHTLFITTRSSKSNNSLHVHALKHAQNIRMPRCFVKVCKMAGKYFHHCFQNDCACLLYWKESKSKWKGIS